MAEQKEPVKRRVALKIVKLGMDTKQVVARFEAERQALALMDHPNIAKVFDGGATEIGRPYFVMELVRGVPITTYCDKHQLSNEQRLELFLPVCAAIQHAHQKGIIHRDIKPSNIMITMHDGVPVPKVIDFGVAKAMLQELTDKTLFTRYEQFIGTPAFMSPEQAEMSGLDVDTRTDVYSLGALLYVLLTGRTPLEGSLRGDVSPLEIRRRIREEEPPQPSQVLSTLNEVELDEAAALRGRRDRQVSALIRNELDWIVLKALDKDRTRRYETASSLALDVRHYLRNEPVTAVAPSRIYAFKKLVARNRLLFTLGAVVVLALGAGLLTATMGVVSARRAQSELRGQLATNESQRRQLAYLAIAGASSAFDLKKWGELAASLEEVPTEYRDWSWHHPEAR